MRIIYGLGAIFQLCVAVVLALKCTYIQSLEYAIKFELVDGLKMIEIAIVTFTIFVVLIYFISYKFWGVNWLKKKVKKYDRSV